MCIRDSPDAEGAQEERVVIENVKFEELDILSFRHGKLVEAEYPFRFAPSDLIYQDSICLFYTSERPMAMLISFKVRPRSLRRDFMIWESSIFQPFILS